MGQKIETTGFYDRIIDHLSTRMLFVDELAPPCISSIGCHIANLQQRHTPFYFVDGDDEDLGLCLSFVAPSGLAKSHSMKQFIKKKNGILPESIKHSFKGKITEAGFIGTVKEDQKKYGTAYHYAEGIVAFNEISNIFLAQQQEHGGELINQIMEALTEREVGKDLASGVLNYETWITIWGGTQPSRMDFTQGLGRRFVFITRSWDNADLLKLKDRRLVRDIAKRIDTREVQSIRDEFEKMQNKFDVKGVEWDMKILKLIHEKTGSHLEMQPLEKLVFGKECIDQYENDVIHIRNSRSNRELIQMSIDMQMMVNEGTDIALLITTMENIDGDEISTSNLFQKMKVYSYNLSTFMALVADCKRLRVIITRFEGGQQLISLNRRRQRR